MSITVQITNKKCIRYLCTNSATNSELAERALCLRLGITPRTYRNSCSSKRREITQSTFIPLKIIDHRLVDFVHYQKKNNGISQRHTVESALIDVIEKAEAAK